MTKRISTLALALAIGATLAACGKSEPAAEAGAEHEIKHIGAFDGDAARGERLAADKQLAGTGQACVDCHGPGGAKPIAPTYPVLAGQYQDYLFQAIHEYRDGEREQVLMNNQIQGAVKAGKLDDQGIADLAAYFAAQTGPLGDLSDR
ncbi:MAG: c-type cytochrome [Lysobacteraceae bacterium]